MESRTEPDPGRDGLHGLDDRDVPAPAGSRSTSPTTRCTRWAAGMMGFSQELFNDQPRHRPGDGSRDVRGDGRRRTRRSTELYLAVSHDDASVVGSGCDDQFEFEFALDLMLDGIERLKERGTSDELSL